MSSLWSRVGVGILLRRSTADGATHLKQYYTLHTAVPKALSDLLDKIKTSTNPITSKGPTQDGEDVDTGDAAGKGSATPYQLPALLNIARLVLTPSGAGGVRAGTTPPKARSRALALDCLSLGLVLHLALSEEDMKYFRREALAVAAVGAKDERWEVRVAAARTAGEVLRRTGAQEKLIHLLSSEQGCWLPALLADGYPEVQHAARAALTQSLACLDGSGDGMPENGLNPAAGSLSSSPSAAAAPVGATSSFPATAAAAAAAAAMRGACEALRAVALSNSAVEPEAGGVADLRAVDLAEEETTRTALRALRGGASLLGSPPGERESHSHLPPLASPSAPPGPREEEEGNKQEATAARVEALESVEALLVATLPEFPYLSVPWAAEGGDQHGAAASAGSAAGVGGLSLEAGETVRALSLGGTEGPAGFRAKALEAATAAVEEFRSECLSAGGDGGREAGGEGGEGLWKRVYCGLLVRLEACSAFMVGPEPPSRPTAVSLPAREGVVVERQDGHDTPAAAPPAQTPIAGEGAGGSSVGGESTTAPAARGSPPSSLARLAEGLAEALEEVPLAYEQAVPPNLDINDDMTISEKNALRSWGGRRRRWMAASTHLLLRAGANLCEQYRRSSCGGAPAAAVAGGSGSGGEEALASVTLVKLLVAALPFEQAATEADDPTEAWLSCMRPPEDTPGLDPAGATAPSAASELTAPIPWESCVHGRALPRHALSAPWASHANTVELAKRLVDVAWSALYLGGDDAGGSGPTAAAETLMRALRAATRARGGWREDAGVGIKHAASAAIRRLRFPLFSGAALGHALPLALPLADDYDPAHQAVGFSLLLRLFAEAPPAELGWHRGLLLEVLERGIRCGGRDPSASALCMTAAVRLLRCSPKNGGGGGGGGERAGIRIARETLAQAARATDGTVKAVMVCGAAALLEVPATGEGYAPCEFLRPALLCLLPILQVRADAAAFYSSTRAHDPPSHHPIPTPSRKSPPVSSRLDARAASLRAVRALCLSCWPRVHAHASKLLCSLLWTCGDCARRASVRTLSTSSSPGGGRANDRPKRPQPSLGVALAANAAAIDPSTDEAVRTYATRLGALVLVLAGDGNGGGGGASAARSTLREICAAVSVLRPHGAAMERLADGAFSWEGAGREGATAIDGEERCRERNSPAGDGGCGDSEVEKRRSSEANSAANLVS
ncbi:unnamed protein product [Ectocarpus sp. CCAP 1310/34]|nr:unnamed protein product [Ectocarpus sp. CCAP 1310/34]